MILHSLKLVDYLHIQADNPWYNYYIYAESVEYDSEYEVRRRAYADPGVGGIGGYMFSYEY